MVSLDKLISWKIWNEHSGRIFKSKGSTTLVVLSHIKLYQRSWTLAGAKRSGHLMPGV
jgi:hypothetical protein